MRRRFTGILALAAIMAIPVPGTAAPAAGGGDESAYESAREAYAAFDVPVTLRGSLTAMMRQHSIALALGYPFVESRSDLGRKVADGALVRLRGNDDYGFRAGVSSLVARPETELFIRRLARGYREACGEKLVVTSLTRPLDRQPSNAHRLSVHPAGIAVDLRVSRRLACRGWLETRLLDMEAQGVLDVTRERYPPHYHVALFPDAYMEAVRPVMAAEREAMMRARREAALLAERETQWFAAVEPRPGVETRAGVGEGWTLLGLLPMLVGVALVARRRRLEAVPNGSD